MDMKKLSYQADKSKIKPMSQTMNVTNPLSDGRSKNLYKKQKIMLVKLDIILKI